MGLVHAAANRQPRFQWVQLNEEAPAGSPPKAAAQAISIRELVVSR